MLSAELSATIAHPWTAMQPLRLGSASADFSTADLFITITDEQRPLMRVDVNRHSEPEAFVFQDAVIWSERVFVGYGSSVYVIDPMKRVGSEIPLGGGGDYFGAFYADADYLLVASGQSLLRLSPDGDVLWTTPDLGLDGVIVKSVENNVISGEGEWDPPGGWEPFEVRLDSGWLLRATKQF